MEQTILFFLSEETLFYSISSFAKLKYCAVPMEEKKLIANKPQKKEPEYVHL